MSIDDGKTPDANSILREIGSDALRGAIENSEDPFADGSADLQPNVAEQVEPYGADRTGAAEEPAWPVMDKAAYHGFAGEVVGTDTLIASNPANDSRRKRQDGTSGD